MFCADCGTQLSDTAKFCRSCGRPVLELPAAATTSATNNNPLSFNTAPAIAVAVAPARDTEMTFLQKDGIRVTSTRFIVPGQTFAMAGITSVRSVKIEPNRTLPIVLLLFGFLFSLVSASRFFGVMLLVIGIVGLLVVKPKYAVGLNSASGEQHAITNPSPEYIASIVNALNEAIVYRR